MLESLVALISDVLAGLSAVAVDLNAFWKPKFLILTSANAEEFVFTTCNNSDY